MNKQVEDLPEGNLVDHLDELIKASIRVERQIEHTLVGPTAEERRIDRTGGD